MEPSDFEAVFVVVPPFEVEPEDADVEEESDDDAPDWLDDAELLEESAPPAGSEPLLELEPGPELLVERLRVSLRESVR